MRRGWVTAAVAVAAVAAGAPAQAQRTAENAVNAAEDAFGTSIGNETVGLYNSNSARGFNPVQAGNIRIDGLYFDQQLVTQGRLYAGTTMRVGLSAQSYPFPAPTGIADIRLRRPTDRLIGSGTAIYGPYESFHLEAEAAAPLVPGRLGGVATVSSVIQGKLDNQTSYHQIVYGALLNWTPSDNVDIVLFDQGHSGTTDVQSLVFTAGGAVPPEYDRSVFFGQPWARRHRTTNHLGLIASAVLADGWLLRTGLFRSNHEQPVDYITFFRNVQPDGWGTLDILQVAPIHDISYSGEVRLTRTIAEGPRRHTFHAAVRARDTEHLFGGGGTQAFGPARVGVVDERPKPVFTLTPPGVDRISQVTPGLSYVGRWLDVAEFSIGLQKSIYRREVMPAGLARARTESEPWLYNSTLAVFLSESAALYGSYTRGLEESGIAPENATNRGEALPASLTEQIDAGVRYRLSQRLSLIAGLFEVKKPYFDRNAANLFTQVGSLTHRGAEISLSGQLAPGLNIVAGAMLLRARIEAHAAVASFIAPVPVGRPNRTLRLNLQYGPPAWRGFSLDGQLSQDGPAFANRANTVELDANTTLDLGARYTFKAFGTSASIRLRALNVTNTYGWTVSPSGSYAPTGARRYSAQLIADF